MRSGTQTPLQVIELLRARRQEIEEAVYTRVSAIVDPGGATDSAYAEGLRMAVPTAVDYGLEALDAGDDRLPAVPIDLIAQARLAARNRVGIDTVLRRYLAGYVLLGEFLAQEATKADLPSGVLRHLMRGLAAGFEQLLVAVSEEYAREAHQPPASAERRRLELVRRLLAGEPAEVSELRYGFDGSHLGLVASGTDAERVVQELVSSVDCTLLAVRSERDVIWAWLGGKHPVGSLELREVAAASAPPQVVVAIGEPAQGLAGWRTTHHQAAAAHPLAQRGSEPVVRYTEVALLTAVLGDELFAASLRHTYLNPLQRGRDGGRVNIETLRAYFEAGRNVSSAAARLRASRSTVDSRLRAVESTLGRSLFSCATDLEVALEMDRLGLG